MYRIEQIKAIVTPLFIAYGVTKGAVFGSYARGDETESSDVDLLFSIGKSMPLSKWHEMEDEIQKALGKRVDFVEYGTLSKRVEQEVLREAVVIYEQA
ncbi:MAG: nucleotidyltransferase domain-containing protein [Hyphomonadaceae bacterium]|nr:nucleotidyltransferase domain-containing protein [Clostridia bacterium]